MGNSIQKNLESAGYEVTRVDPVVEQLSEYKDDISIFVFYLGKFLEDIPEVLVYLKDVCIEEEKMLVLLGNADEISAVENAIPKSAIAAKFERPVDLKRLVAEVGILAQAVETTTLLSSR